MLDFRAAREVCSDVFARRMIGSMHVAFGVWHDETAHRRALRLRMAGVVSRMASRQLASAFNSWVGLLEGARARRALLSRAAARLMNLALHASWDKWRACSCKGSLTNIDGQ